MTAELPNATITFVIEHAGKFLVVCRAGKEDNYPALWAFPGGKVEIGETAIDTIVREVREETGLTLTDECIFLDSYFFNKTVGFAFLVRATSNLVVLESGLTDHRWISSLAELSELRCIPGIHNHLVRALEMMVQGRYDSLAKMNLREEIYLNR